MWRICLPAAVMGCVCVDAMGADEPSTQSVVVATVGAEPIYEGDVQRLLRKVTGGKQVNPAALPVMRAEVLQQIVRRRLVLAYARHSGSGAAAAEIDKALGLLKSKLASQGRTVDEYLRQQSIGDAELRRQIAWNLTWPKLLGRYVTEERLAAYFKDHRRELDGTQLSVSHVLLRPESDDPAAWDDLLERAETIRREIGPGKVSFAESARRHSAGPSGRDGGRLGWIARHGTMAEAFSQAAFALDVGQISEPVRTRFGVHLIHCDEIRPGKRQLDEVREQVEQSLARDLLQKLARHERRHTPVHIAAQPPVDPNVRYRGSLDNSRIQFQRRKKGHVAFIGGSITEMNGYRPMVCDILRRRFPETEFTFTDAGISSTCSTTGAFRLASDVLAVLPRNGGPVDLFFIEFAVNDDQDAGHARRECIRGMEGIVRHARRHNPSMDMVITYFVNPGMLEIVQAGKTPLSAGSHEEVARHYGISTIDLAAEVARRIEAGTLTWKEFGGTHPAPKGNAICAGMIDRLLSIAWSQPLPAPAAGRYARKSAHPMPGEPLDVLSYERGRFVDPKNAQIVSGWKLHRPAWKEIGGGFRKRFAETPMLCGEKPGAELTLKFEGTAIGAYVLAGPDAGVVEAAVDGGPLRQVDLFHRFSRGLHYPRTVMFHTDLKPGRHTLRLRVAGRKNAESSGHAVRIMQFAAN